MKKTSKAMKLFFLMEDTPITYQYRVITDIKSEGQEASFCHKEEEISIKLIETVVKGTLVRIERAQRQLKVSSSTSDIATAMNVDKIFSDLDLIISEEGKIVCINNYGYICEKWQKYKSELNKIMLPKDQEQSIANMNNMMSDSVLLLDFLRRDIFLYFWLRLFGYYADNLLIRSRQIPAFLGTSFWIKEQLEYIQTKEGNTQIHIEGNLAEDKDILKQSQHFFLDNDIVSNSIDVEFRSQYNLLPNNMLCSMDILLATKPKQDIFYKRLSLQVNNLNRINR